MRLNVTQITGRRHEVEVARLQVEDLHVAVSEQLDLPRDRLRLVHRGQPLTEQAAVAKLRDGDSLLAIVAPRPPPQKLRDLADGGAEDDDEELIRFRLAEGAPAWQRRGLAFLRTRLRMPDWALTLLLGGGWRFWGGLAAWAAACKVASWYDLGPVFFIASIFALILLNLGRREEGSFSAYSLFNPGGRRLAGQLTAEELDGQLRRGNL